jgi:hypothetical protein
MPACHRIVQNEFDAVADAIGRGGAGVPQRAGGMAALGFDLLFKDAQHIWLGNVGDIHAADDRVDERRQGATPFSPMPNTLPLGLTVEDEGFGTLLEGHQASGSGEDSFRFLLAFLLCGSFQGEWIDLLDQLLARHLGLRSRLVQADVAG